MTDKKITVYVRAPDDETRTLSFKRIPEITTEEALEHGWAIDGNSIVEAVTAYFDDLDRIPLHDSLSQSQQSMIAFLKEKGYQVEFD